MGLLGMVVYTLKTKPRSWFRKVNMGATIRNHPAPFEKTIWNWWYGRHCLRFRWRYGWRITHFCRNFRSITSRWTSGMYYSASCLLAVGLATIASQTFKNYLNKSGWNLTHWNKNPETSPDFSCYSKIVRTRYLPFQSYSPPPCIAFLGLHVSILVNRFGMSNTIELIAFCKEITTRPPADAAFSFLSGAQFRFDHALHLFAVNEFFHAKQNRFCHVAFNQHISQVHQHFLLVRKLASTLNGRSCLPSVRAFRLANAFFSFTTKSLFICLRQIPNTVSSFELLLRVPRIDRACLSLRGFKNHRWATGWFCWFFKIRLIRASRYLTVHRTFCRYKARPAIKSAHLHRLQNQELPNHELSESHIQSTNFSMLSIWLLPDSMPPATSAR